MNLRYWIFDQDESPQRFPLQRLFSLVVQVTPYQAAEKWNITRTQGYGLAVNEIADKSDAADSVSIGRSALHSILTGVDEWFYDIAVESSDGFIRFGLHDSSAMFVEGPTELIETVVGNFSKFSKAHIL
jgi:hypothetical protein